MGTGSEGPTTVRFLLAIDSHYSQRERNGEHNCETIVVPVRPVFARKHRAWHAKSGHFGKPLGTRTMPVRRTNHHYFELTRRLRRRHHDRAPRISPDPPPNTLFKSSKGIARRKLAKVEFIIIVQQRGREIARFSRGNVNTSTKYIKPKRVFWPKT